MFRLAALCYTIHSFVGFTSYTLQLRVDLAAHLCLRRVDDVNELWLERCATDKEAVDVLHTACIHQSVFVPSNQGRETYRAPCSCLR